MTYNYKYKHTHKPCLVREVALSGRRLSYQRHVGPIYDYLMGAA